jgi:predicted ribosome quality control (RQC) complex YloA/Tae2 family protein
VVSNYYTLRHIALDLERRWVGRILTSIFSQERNVLALMTDNEDVLVVSCEPSENSISLRSGYTRARRNTVDLFARCIDHSLRFVSIHSSDRELTLGLDNDLRLIIRLYGSKANVYLADLERSVLEGFLRPKESVGSAIDTPSGIPPLPSSEQELADALASGGKSPLSIAIKHLHPLFGPLLIRELFFRTGVDGTEPVSGLDKNSVGSLFREMSSLVAELTGTPFPCIYYKGSRPSVFSIIQLRHLGQARMEKFDSIHKGIQVFVTTSRREEHLEDELGTVIGKLEKERDKIGRTLQKVEDETESIERAEWYERAGKLLMASLNSITKGMDRVQLQDTFSSGQESVEIALDPRASPVRNAEQYFEKARKARHSLEEQKERIQSMNDRLIRVKGMLTELGRIDSVGVWREFATSREDELKDFGIVLKGKSVQEEERVPFRVFTVDGGFQVWAGKSSENNDLLTLKFAKPHDLWFHARGAGGSHVVLRLGTGKGEVSRRAKEQAASIAAYYSKMKGAGLVPVAMTEKKYVRKPKGAPAGTVAVEREKILMVPPRLPEAP